MSAALATRAATARERGLRAALSVQKRRNPEGSHLSLAL
jgi:hypothetical protein